MTIANASLARIVREIRTELVAAYVSRLGHPEVAKQIRQHFAILDKEPETETVPTKKMSR